MATEIASYTIPEPSTAFVSEVVFEKRGGTVRLRYEYDRDGVVYRSGIAFAGVRALRQQAESHCTAELVREAYDTLVEVEGSDWIRELRAAQPERNRGCGEVRHYMIYLDGSGCYEVVARSWEALPEQEGAWE